MKPGGKGKNPSEAEVAAMQAQAQAQIAGMLVGLVKGLSSAPLSPESVQTTALAVLRQQEALGRVIDDAIEPGARASHGEWGVKIIHRASGAEGVIRVPKDFAACQSIEQMLHHATVVALVTNPTPRVLLFAHGLDLEFFQAPTAPKIEIAR